MRLIRFADMIATPWKNGGGVTRELAVHRDPARHPDFLWRVSLATVSRPGPFSQFDGIDRSIAVLAGTGMILSAPSGDTRLDHDAPPHGFAGETPITATPIAGDTIDLNAMTRRGHFRHHMARIAIAGPSTLQATNGETIIVFASAATVTAGSDRFTVEPLDALVGIARGESVLLSAPERGSALIVGID